MAFIFGLFGLIVGSFLNVLILRYPHRPLSGRSACACGKNIPWYDLVPVLSWLSLRGRARCCGARISVQYPLVEASTGILFALIGGAPLLALGYKAPFCIIAALLLAIAVYDLRTTFIPDAWVYAFDALALAVMGSLLSTASDVSFPLFLAAGPFAALPLFALWAYSRGAWMGLGDVKLALGMGWLLGPHAGVFAVFFAFVLGAAVSLPLLFFSSASGRRMLGHLTPRGASRMAAGAFTMKSEIPFGPFLVASCLFVWLAHLYGIEIPLWSVVYGI